MDMAERLIALFAVIVSGCVPVMGRLYVPVNASDAVVNRNGACSRYAYYDRKVGDVLTLRVSITESGSEPPQLLIEGRGKGGRVPQFVDSVKVSSASGITYFEPLLSGFLPQSFRLPSIASQSETIVVSLPPVIVNRTAIEIEPIAFKPEPNSGMLLTWVCQ